MNSLRVNGEIVSQLKMTTNTKKGCPRVNFKVAVPFDSPYVPVKDDYRTWLNTNVDGDNAEWIYDNLYEGAHIEIRQGFLQTWFRWSDRTSFYSIVGHYIDREHCGEKPEDYTPYNVIRLAGSFRMQFCDDVTESGIHKVGFSMKAPPDKSFYDSKYAPFVSVLCFDELADKVADKMKDGDKIDLVEGKMQSFYGSVKRTWGVYVIADRVEF